MAWLGSAVGTAQYALGVDRFGESGTVADLHEIVGIDAGTVVKRHWSHLQTTVGPDLPHVWFDVDVRTT